ncbi:unnamed protein product, partial [Didymodactylos carnosus]
MSMVGLILLARFGKKLTEAKRTDPSLPFTGINVIFFGDLLQYSPVGDKPLYSDIITAKPDEKIHHEGDRKDRPLPDLLRTKLNQQAAEVQMRTTDTQYLDLLKRLREGKCTEGDYQLLLTRVVHPDNDVKSLEDPMWMVAPLLVFRNELRTQLNNKAVISLTCKDGYKPQQNWLYPMEVSGGLSREESSAQIVLLTDNLATELALSNGTRGIFRKLVYEEAEVNPDIMDEENFPTHCKKHCALSNKKAICTPIHHLYCWLEQDIKIIRQLCGMGLNKDDDNSGNVDPLSEDFDERILSDTGMNDNIIEIDRAQHQSLTSSSLIRTGDFETKFKRLIRRRQWLKSNEYLLRTLVSFTTLHGMQGG